MTNESTTIFHLEIPVVGRFVTAGGGITKRSTVLVRLGSGPYGWGEAAPYPGQDEPIGEVAQAARTGDSTPTLRAAFDEAEADLLARRTGASLREQIGAIPDPVPISIAVGIEGADQMVDRAVALGITRFKLKIGPGDLDHVGQIRRRHPDVLIGVDANGSFTHASADELDVLAPLNVTYLEQPVADMASEVAATIGQATGIPIFADESIRSPADAERLLVLEHIEGVVVKPGRLGWSGALEVRAIANRLGKRWRASGLLETGIGRAYTNTLAASPDAFVSDVAPAEWFLESDVGRPSDPGIGVEGDPALIERYLVGRFDVS